VNQGELKISLSELSSRAGGLKVEAMLEPVVHKKIEELIRKSSQIAPQGIDDLQWPKNSDKIAACRSWIAEALNIIDHAVPIENNAYRQAIIQLGGGQHHMLDKLHSMSAILSSLLADRDAGLIADFGNKIRAETFDDFLDHADIYRQEKQHQPAGVLAGVVFEDTIRRICRDKGINEKGEDLDKLISALLRQTVITGQQAKQARVAAHVRTKATHAQWDEYDLDGVGETIAITRTFLREHLGG
jgi:hypothetical protein